MLALRLWIILSAYLSKTSIPHFLKKINVSEIYIYF